MYETIESILPIADYDSSLETQEQSKEERRERVEEEVRYFMENTAALLKKQVHGELDELPFFQRSRGKEMHDLLERKGLDTYKFQAMSGAEAATYLQEKKLGQFVGIDEVANEELTILICQRPKPLAQWWNKGKNPKNGEGDLNGAVIEWATVYRNTIDELWYQTRTTEIMRDLTIERINPPGMHNDDFYYVWLVQDFNDYLPGIVNKDKQREWEKERNYSSAEIEKLVEDPELLAFLTKHKAEVISTSDPELGKERQIIKFKHKQKLPVDLPEGYGYIGGVARSTILREMGEDALPPRDLDIVAVEELLYDPKLMDELSQKYMPEDSQHGFPIKEESLSQYFNKRDFVINEILVAGNEVYATPQALYDLQHKIIRPTAREKIAWESVVNDEKGLFPKLVVKALRLEDEFRDLYGKGEIQEVADWQFRIESLPAFYIALQLEKAFSRGDRMAHRFYTRLLQKGTVTKSTEESRLQGDSAPDLAMSLRWKMHAKGDSPFDFTREELNEYTQERNFDPQDTETDYYEDLAEGRHIRNADPREPYNRRAKRVNEINRYVPFPYEPTESKVRVGFAKYDESNRLIPTWEDEEEYVIGTIEQAFIDAMHNLEDKKPPKALKP